MIFAKLLTLLILAAGWVFAGLIILVFTMPLWGMSPEGSGLPYRDAAMFVGFILWLSSYAWIAIKVVRSGKPA